MATRNARSSFTSQPVPLPGARLAWRRHTAVASCGTRLETNWYNSAVTRMASTLLNTDRCASKNKLRSRPMWYLHDTANWSQLPVTRCSLLGGYANLRSVVHSHHHHRRHHCFVYSNSAPMFSTHSHCGRQWHHQVSERLGKAGQPPRLPLPFPFFSIFVIPALGGSCGAL